MTAFGWRFRDRVSPVLRPHVTNFKHGLVNILYDPGVLSAPTARAEPRLLPSLLRCGRDTAQAGTGSYVRPCPAGGPLDDSQGGPHA